jgi:PAS domain S-box-containing protein
MMNFMIVDDNEENLYMLQVLLESQGYKVSIARNGAEALEKARSNPPDLVVSDILMPVMDGFTLCRRWKNDALLKHIPLVVYSSSYTDERDRDLALSLGAERYIMKPTDPDVILQILREVIAGHKEGRIPAPREPVVEEIEYYREYNEALIRRLEEKLMELEEANRALERDFVERRHAEEALKKSEEKYRKIFENAVEGIFQSTPDGRFLSVNPALARRYGYESPQDMMASITDIEHQLYVNPEERKIFKEIIKTQGSIEAFETRQYKKDGDVIWVSLNAHAVCDENGTIPYYEGTSEDITNRKRAEEEKARLEEQLLQAQKMEAIGQLAGGIAHDFNNILTVLMGYCNLLQMKMVTDDSLKVYVDQILAASEKAANLTQALLAFSRKQVMELKPHNINTIIRGMEKLLQRLITEDIELKTELTDKDVTIMADITQIDQVLLNLATNAQDAMPKGGQLKVTTKLVEFDHEFIRVHGYGEPGKYALISISDTGVGIDEKTRGKIFEPFFTTKEMGKGTGLGLSIVYGIVKQHNGYINVYSEPGEGATFHIYFPALEAAVEAARPAFLDIKGGGERILIAEDNNELRVLIVEVLKSKGYTTIDAINGEEAVKKFIEYQDTIDLLVFDVVMPRKNGIEAYKEIKKLQQNIKVLFMSGYTGDVVLDKGLNEEGFSFISKPLSPNELLKKVRDVLNR